MAEDNLRIPSLQEVLRLAQAAWARGLYVALPARVEEYEPGRQVVRAQPMVGTLRVDSDGEELEELFPSIVDVPVCWLGAGGARLTFPVAAGDFGLLLFSDRSLDEWKVNRGVQPGVPNDMRTHSIHDAFFLPGLRPPSNPWGGVRTDALTMGYANEQGQGMQVHITPAMVALGEPTPVYAVALAEQVKTQLQALRDTVNALVAAYNAHTHGVTGTANPGGLTVVGTAAAVLASATPPASVADMGSTTVKVKG